MKTATLYFGAPAIRRSLAELGPPATLGEGHVATAAKTLAELIETAWAHPSHRHRFELYVRFNTDTAGGGLWRVEIGAVE